MYFTLWTSHVVKTPKRPSLGEICVVLHISLLLPLGAMKRIPHLERGPSSCANCVWLWLCISAWRIARLFLWRITYPVWVTAFYYYRSVLREKRSLLLRAFHNRYLCVWIAVAPRSILCLSSSTPAVCVFFFVPSNVVLLRLLIPAGHPLSQRLMITELLGGRWRANLR